jgi:hypothetical protein
MRDVSSKTQQIAGKSERFWFQNAASSTQIRDFGSKMQQIARKSEILAPKCSK